MNLSPPTDADIAALGAQLARASALVAHVVPSARLGGTDADLALWQRVLDSGWVAGRDTYDLQSLGAAFGSLLIDSFPGLDWVIIEDEYGREATVRYKDSSLAINVLTMISKRVEDGEAVDVRRLFEKLLAGLPQLLGEMGVDD